MKKSKSAKYKRPHRNTYYHDPLAGNIASDPKVPPEFYIEELLDWIFGNLFWQKQEARKESDCTIQYNNYPAVPDEQYPKEYWKNGIQKKDFSLQFNKIRDNGSKSYSHHRFCKYVIKTIKKHPEELVSAYARRKSLNKILNPNNYKGDLDILKAIKDDLRVFLTSKDKQLIPALFHIRNHGIIMSYDLQKVETLDVKTEGFTYEYIFSKTTSDNFTKALICVLEDREALLFNMEIKNHEKQNNKTEKNISQKGTKSKMQSILRELNIRHSGERNREKLGIPATVLLFDQIKKSGILDKNISSSHFALAISILTGYSFDELYNRCSDLEKDLHDIFNETKNQVIEVKLSKSIKSLQEIISNMESYKKKI